MIRKTSPVDKLVKACIALATAATLFVLPEGARAAQRKRTAGTDGEAVVARVNGEPLARSELQRMLTAPLEREGLLRELGARELERGELERLALRKLVSRELLLREAGRRKLVVTDRELDEAVASLRRRFGDLRSFGAWMKARGLDDRSLFENVRTGMLVARVSGALVAGVRVTEDEVGRYYEAHAGDLKREEVRLQIIAVETRAKALEVLAALEKGEEFGGLARKRSVGVRAAQGGDTGWVGAETLAPPLRETVGALKPREYVGPLERGDRYLVVRLHDRRAGRTKSLPEARPEIERRLLAAAQQETLRAWLTEQEKKANVELLPRPDLVGPGELQQ